MEYISWMEEDIVECTPTIPILNTFSVGMVGFVDPHKVVIWKNAFIVLGNAQSDGVLEGRTESFGHTWLKHSFSQVEGDLELQEIPKLVPLPKERTTKKKEIIVTMKEEDEECDKVEKVGNNWANGEVLHLIALWREMEFEFTKNAKKKGKYQLIEP